MAEAGVRRPERGARDVLVTGMGFCLPGGTAAAPLFTAEEIWDVAANGRSCIVSGGIYHGRVDLTEAMFDERFPELPSLYTSGLTRAHRFGLVSFAEACADGKLDFRAGDLTEAAVLVGRGGLDDNIDPYIALRDAEPEQMAATAATALFIRAQLGITSYDVTLLQASLARSTGPSFTVSCGCSSSTVQLGIALRMIATGEVDVAVVTGVDAFSMDIMRNAQRLLFAAKRGGPQPGADTLPETLPSMDRPMRPYDVRADCVNFGEGSVTVVLESRQHAEQRGAHIYGQLLAQATTRDGLASPLSLDDSGAALVAAVRSCLGDRWSVDQIPYVNGGSDGDMNVTMTESNAIRELYGPAVPAVLLSSQEACFGHSGAQSGNLGLALTLLMMEKSQVCPTANCEQPVDFLSFDPIPGTRPRPLDFDHALSFTYQIGGLKSVVLMSSADAC
ncbi:MULTISPECIES: beta-ketoacyl synthase [unclassified Frankia]|uniref:beta-ketoacyl-[acyl-carrier-protein] synthase family protein n=1 Tax=unclassified Frankia TaxID=2632575 RepID=UPI000E2EF66A|nr:MULTISPECIES: beta-ketoacyl synthase N-terminal-like domain-containing protein [unclassified Frankia]